MYVFLLSRCESPQSPKTSVSLLSPLMFALKKLVPVVVVLTLLVVFNYVPVGVFSTLVRSSLANSVENELELYPPWLETYRYVNETYKVTCKTQTFQNLTWIASNGTPITEENGRIRIRKIQFGLMLIFERLETNAEGEYGCLATSNSDGLHRNNSFRLRVAEPVIFVSPSVYEVVMSEDVLLKCHTMGSNSPEKHWEFDGSIVTAGEPYTRNNDVLPITNVGLQHAGRYLCVVAHSPFQSNRNILQVTLIVHYKPMPHHGRKSEMVTVVYGFINETTSIMCQVLANPTAWFIWHRDFDKALDPKEKNVTIINDNSTSILQATLREGTSEEMYSCKACNQLGCLTQTYWLYPTRKLHKPEVGLWDTYPDSAKFYVSFQKEATFYLFEYFFSVYGYNWTEPFRVNFTVGYRKPQLGSYMSFQLLKLHPDTKYIARVAAGNWKVVSEFSQERKFKTRINSGITLPCNSGCAERSKFTTTCRLLILLLAVMLLLYISR